MAFALALGIFWGFGRGVSDRVAGTIFAGIYLATLTLAVWIGFRLGRPTGMGRNLTTAIVTVLITAMITTFTFVEALNSCLVGRSFLLTSIGC